jgi:excisionase family DNA binding protein
MTNKASSVAKRFYTPKEAAELLGVSSTTVMSRIHDGALPAVRVSDRIYRIPIPAFERFVSTAPERSFEIRYVLTGADGPQDDGAEHPRLPFETTMPGVFALGDVRAGSVKRIAAAVGEGSAAVAQVHRYLARVAAGATAEREGVAVAG